MTTARRWMAWGLVAACLIAGCGEAPTGAKADACGAPPVAEPGELRTVLRATSFGAEALILTSAALPDGSVVVAYDANPEEAGGEENWKPDPGLVLFRTDGTCEPFPLPVVDGRRVGLDAQPVAVDADGRLYLWDAGECRFDSTECRLVRGTTADSAWETVAVVPANRLMYTLTPPVAVGRQGEIYIATDFLVSRVTVASKLEPVAGTGKRPPGSDYPPPDLGDFPRPGTSAPLTHLRGIAAEPSGGVVITMQSAVLELDASGTLDLIADPKTTAGQDGAIEARHDDDTGAEAGSNLGPAAVTDSGDVLVSDLPKKRILKIRDGQSSVFMTTSSYVSVSAGQALLPDDAGLLVRVHEEQGHSLAVLGLPAD